MSIANIAAGIQVMKTGAAVITWQEVYEELIQLSEKNANRKILQVSDLSSLRELYSTKKIVFTNGCFDLLHIGHIHCLLSASNYGDILVVGINSDSSIKRIKGEERPVIPQNERVEILSALECVDYVILYEEDTPCLLYTSATHDQDTIDMFDQVINIQDRNAITLRDNYL